MKKRKLWKALTGTILAALMTVTAVMPAMAAGGTVSTTDSGKGKIAVSKVLEMAQKDAPVDETFTFTMSGTGTVSDAPEDTPAPTPANPSFTLGGDTSVWGGAAVSGNNKTLTGSWDPEITFSAIGRYTYTIQETKGSSAGMTYDENTYNVTYTVVHGESGLEILSMAVYDTEDKKQPSPVAFTNQYDTADIRIEKEVTGNLGDKDKEFSFSLTLNNGAARIKNYTYTIYGSDNQPIDGKTGTATLGSQLDFTLQNEQYLVVSYLPVGTTYSVTESSEGIEDYTTTITNKETEGSPVTGAENRNASGSIATGNNIVHFENNKETTGDTGIMLDVLPFVGIVLFAAAILAAMVFRKTRMHR